MYKLKEDIKSNFYVFLALLRKISYLLEASIVQTDAINSTKALLTVEERVNFSLSTLSTRSEIYDHFVHCLKELDEYCPDNLKNKHGNACKYLNA